MRHGYTTLRRSALRLGGISQKIAQLKTIYLFAVKSFSSVVDFVSFFFLFYSVQEEMDDIVYPRRWTLLITHGAKCCVVQGLLSFFLLPFWCFVLF
jgi:hypothetical protein